MTEKQAPKVFNIPVKVLGWRDDKVGARLELLADVPGTGMTRGQEVPGTFRYDPRKLDSKQITFDTYFKRGLLRGGILLLRRAYMEQDGSLSAKEADILFTSHKYGLSFVAGNAAVSILPPPTLQTVKDGYVALVDHAIRVKKLPDALDEVLPYLELARSVGQPGLILTGVEADGTPSEYIVGGKAGLTADKICAALSANIDPELLKFMARTKSQWYLLPFFKADIDPDRVSKMSGQRANINYGDEDQLSWTACTCILRNPGDAWYITDTTPMQRDVPEPKMLLDIIRESDR